LIFCFISYAKLRNVRGENKDFDEKVADFLKMEILFQINLR